MTVALSNRFTIKQKEHCHYCLLHHQACHLLHVEAVHHQKAVSPLSLDSLPQALHLFLPSLQDGSVPCTTGG